MPLVAELEGSFGAGGFDLSVTVSGLGTSLDAVDVPAASFDSGALDSILGSLGGGDLQPIVAAVAAAVERLASASGVVPDLGALLGPLQPALTAIGLAGTDLAALGARLAAVDAGRTDPGIETLVAAIGAGASLTADPTVRALSDLLGSAAPGLDLVGAASAVTGPLSGVAAIVELVGGLMAVESATTDLAVGVDVTASFLAAGALHADLDRLLGWADSGILTDLVTGIDPDEPGVVDLVAGPILEYAATLRRFGDAVVTGMAFGEATLTGLDLPGLAQRIDEATALVQRADLAAVGSVLADLGAKIDGLLTFDLPSPPAVDDFVAGIDGVVATLAQGIDSLDPARLTAPLGDALGTLVAPLAAVGEAAHEVVAAAQAGLGAVRQVVDAVDLRPVTDAIATVTAPIVDALDALEALVGAATAAVQTAVGAVGDAVHDVQDALHAAADLIRAAFTAVADAVDALGLDEIGTELQAGAQAVAGAVAGAQLAPVFDVVVTALDVAADALSLTPRDLLPDDVKKALDDACAALQAVDMEGVREALRQELDGIESEVDDSILDGLRDAQAAVVGFLDTIDPRPPLEDLESGAFADVVSRLRAADPSTPLAPIIDAVDEARAAVAGFDPAALLAPLDGAVQSVADAIGSFDPAALLAPVEQQVTAARLAVADALELDRWDRLVAGLSAALSGFMTRLDPAAVVTAIDAAHAALVADARRPATGPGPLGTVITALVEGTGLRVRADAFAEVQTWLAGVAQPTAAVVERLSGAVATVEGLTATVESLDLRGIVGRLDADHTRLVAALAVHADTSLLRLRVDADLSGASPGTLLGSVLLNRDGYLGALRDAGGALHRLAAASRSELDAAAGALRTAAAPLANVVARIRALVHATTGVEVDGRPLRDALGDLLDRVRPSLLLGPLADALVRLHDRTLAALDGALLAPLEDALTTVHQTIDAFDISFIRTELTAARDDVIAAVVALRPSTLLGPVLADAESLRDRIAAFDPLGPVRAVVDGMKATVDQFAREFAPTALAAPALDAYDTVRGAVAAVSVDHLLQPVLDALSGVADQLETGMDRLVDALHRVQDACASGGPSLGAALGAAADVAGALTGGVDVSVGAGIGF